MKHLFFCFAISLLFLTNYLCAEPKLLSVDNEFVKIVVNNENYDKGRFAIETVEGDPNNPFDNHQPLIYGRPKPWTSFTSVIIDGKIYAFGGKTLKRAGKRGLYGEIVSQKKVDGSIITVCKFDNIFVTQTLSLIRNQNTKVKDTVLIGYDIKNLDQIEHKIGLRIMLDTMLGTNDGAPFRIGEKAIESEKKLEGSEILDYWQTFDSLVSPNIIAQGTLKLDSEQVLPPDRMYLVNWGTLADNAWDFSYEEARSFIREGENVKDTALALYWEQKVIAPKESRSIKTLYGLGSVSFAAGDLTLGLATPGEIYATSKSSFLIMGYLLNSGGVDSKKTKLTFELPKELKIIAGKPIYDLNLLKTKEAKQIALNVKIDKPIPGEKIIKLKVDSDTLESNIVTRSITFIPPPNILDSLIAPKEYLVSDNTHVKIELILKNTANISVTNIKNEIYFDDALELPFFEITNKEVKTLKPAETKKINWYLKIKNQLKKFFLIKVKVSSNETGVEEKEINIKEIKPDGKLKINLAKPQIFKNEYFIVSLTSKDNLKLTSENITIIYDTSALKLIRVSPYPILDTALVNDELSIDKILGIVSLNNIVLEDIAYFENNLLKLNFKALKKGAAKIMLKRNDMLIDEINLNIEEMPQ